MWRRAGRSPQVWGWFWLDRHRLLYKIYGKQSHGREAQTTVMNSKSHTACCESYRHPTTRCRGSTRTPRDEPPQELIPVGMVGFPGGQKRQTKPIHPGSGRAWEARNTKLEIRNGLETGTIQTNPIGSGRAGAKMRNKPNSVIFELKMRFELKNKANWVPARPGQWLVASDQWLVDLKMRNKANWCRIPTNPGW